MSEHDPIDHVIVLMLENCSFDRVLGACKTDKSAIDGIDTLSKNPRTNCYDGESYPQVAGAARVV